MTPLSYIYAIGSDHFNFVKIGYSSNPKNRLWGLQNANPYKLKLLSVWGPWKASQIRQVEETIHNMYHEKRVSGEWFDVPITTIQCDLSGYEDGVA